MKIFTMGFTQKTAEQFFGKIIENNIEIVIDVRLNNQSQLAGFTKGKDLAYFLKVICGCEYANEIDFAPTKDLLNQYKNKELSWDKYEIMFNKIMEERKVVEVFKRKFLNYNRVLLLCSEPTSENCHRRLLAEKIAGEIPADVIHI